MGLLRKAAGAVSVGDTNVSPLAARERPVSSASKSLGLLKRSIRALAASSAERSSDAQTAVPLSDNHLTRDLVAESKALSDGVELPSRLFTTLRKRLSLTKSALLLYDPMRLEYAPWASHGFDQTTLHRMRIPLGANETFNALANGDPLEVTNPAQRAAFQRFFSSREFSVLERIILCPYIFEDTLVGVLLITEAHPPFSGAAAFLSCLKDVAADVRAPSPEGPRVPDEAEPGAGGAPTRHAGRTGCAPSRIQPGAREKNAVPLPQSGLLCSGDRRRARSISTCFACGKTCEAFLMHSWLTWALPSCCPAGRCSSAFRRQAVTTFPFSFTSFAIFWAAALQAHRLRRKAPWSRC